LFGVAELENLLYPSVLILPFSDIPTVIGVSESSSSIITGVF